MATWALLVLERKEVCRSALRYTVEPWPRLVRVVFMTGAEALPVTYRVLSAADCDAKEGFDVG